MKTLLITLSLMTTFFSTQAYAVSDAASANTTAVTFSPLFPLIGTTFVSSATTEGLNAHKEALQIINEGQEYFQSGDMAVLIGSKVEQLQAEQDMSDDEAVDALMNLANDILK